MQWRNLLSVGKVFAKNFSGDLKLKLKDTTNGAEWNNPQIFSFASSLSTVDRAFIFDTNAKEISDGEILWSSNSVLCEPKSVYNHNLLSSPYIYPYKVDNIHGNIVVKGLFKVKSGRAPTCNFGFDLFINNEIYSTFKAQSWNGGNPSVYSIKNIFEYSANGYFRSGGSVYNYSWSLYTIMINIIGLKKQDDLKIEIRNRHFTTTQGSINIENWEINLNNLKFYDIQNTTTQKAKCLAIGVESFHGEDV